MPSTVSQSMYCRHTLCQVQFCSVNMYVIIMYCNYLHHAVHVFMVQWSPVDATIPSNKQRWSCKRAYLSSGRDIHNVVLMQLIVPMLNACIMMSSSSEGAHNNRGGGNHCICTVYLQTSSYAYVHSICIVHTLWNLPPPKKKTSWWSINHIIHTASVWHLAYLEGGEDSCFVDCLFKPTKNASNMYGTFAKAESFPIVK